MGKKKNRESVKPIELESDPETTVKLNNTVNSNKPDSSEPTSSKRPATSELKKSEKAKKSKKNAVETESNSSKKPQFQRVFSDEDEIVILNGMIEFETKNKMSPIADVDAFLEFIKNNGLNADVSTKQLQEKIRKMKAKYENNKGKDRSLVKPHEKAFLDLSDKLWPVEKVKEKANGTRMVKSKYASKKEGAEVEAGSGNGTSVVKSKNEDAAAEVGNGNETSVVKSKNASKKEGAVVEVGNGNETSVVKSKNASEKEGAAVEVGNGNETSVVKSKKEGVAVEDVVSKGAVGLGKMMGSSYVGLSYEEKLIKKGMEMFEGEDKVAGWEEWKKLEREELELSLEQLDIKRTKMRLVLEIIQ